LQKLVSGAGLNYFIHTRLAAAQLSSMRRAHGIRKYSLRPAPQIQALELFIFDHVAARIRRRSTHVEQNNTNTGCEFAAVRGPGARTKIVTNLNF
jgi:hypothetical protein